MNNSNLAYSAVTHLPPVNRLSVEKNLQSQSAHPINYSQSIVNNTTKQSISPGSSNTQGSSVVLSKTNPELDKQQEQIQQVISQLKARDTEVRAHEMAHLAAAGMHALWGYELHLSNRL